MAKTENENYIVVGQTTTIKASSRASIKVGDNYYTVEWTEERTIPDIHTVNIAKEREALWETVNGEVDGQIEDILEAYSKKRH